MRKNVLALIVLICLGLSLKANDPINDNKSNAANKVLIIAGGQANAESAFSAMKRNKIDLSFETLSYPVHEKFGAGNNVTLDLSNIYQFEYVLISIDQGTLSERCLKELAKYIYSGGKVFMLYDSNKRDCFSESMAENANMMLQMIKVNDEIKFENIKFDQISNGSILPITDKTRKYFTTNKSINWMKNQGNREYTKYSASMGSGHCFYKGSDLNDSSLILEFNNSNGKYHTGAFWKVGNGVLGIGTEKLTSADADRYTYKAGEIIWESLNINEPSEGLTEYMHKPAELKTNSTSTKKKRRKRSKR